MSNSTRAGEGDRYVVITVTLEKETTYDDRTVEHNKLSEPLTKHQAERLFEAKGKLLRLGESVEIYKLHPIKQRQLKVEDRETFV